MNNFLDINTVNPAKPFGPVLFECICPNEIVNNLNYFIDNLSEDEKKICSSKYTTNKNFPNLLERDFEIVYLTPKISFESKLSFFLLEIAKLYSNYLNASDSGIIFPNSLFSDELLDAWINRYYESDYTPPHSHRGDISGIIILDLPDDSTEMEKRNLEFVWNNEHYRPIQEVGKTFLFPSNLMHWVAKQTNVKERRTLSFNLFLNTPQQ
jgi:hypothetical protein